MGSGEPPLPTSAGAIEGLGVAVVTATGVPPANTGSPTPPHPTRKSPMTNMAKKNIQNICASDRMGQTPLQGLGMG